MSVIEAKNRARKVWKEWRREKDPERRAELAKEFGKAQAVYHSLKGKAHAAN